ncbi:MAG TPA: hypothetical protein VIN57_05125 [Magnetovibrio sp.]
MRWLARELLQKLQVNPRDGKIASELEPIGEPIMRLDQINSWLPSIKNGEGVSGKRWTSSSAIESNGGQTHRETGHVPVDKADAEKRARLASSDAEKSDYERIVEHGFGKFMEDLEARKREKLREKILGEMGLNEEMLSKMSPEQRGEIEKVVAEEIRRRMEAAAQMNGETKAPHTDQNKDAQGQDGMAGAQKKGLPQGVPQGVPPVMSNGMGLGPLLALQESSEAKGELPTREQHGEPGRNDRAKT